MKIIILIIADDSTENYLEMQKIWKKYMNINPNIKSYFIKNNPNIYGNILIDDENSTIYTKYNENLIPGCLLKTIDSIEYILNNIDFKYIYRTNLSSFLNLNKFYEYANNNNFDYSAVIGNHNGIIFGSGSGFFISKNVCKYIIDNKNIIDYKLIDDVSIGKLLIPKFNIISCCRIDIENIDDVKDIQSIINTNIFHFRCKNLKNHNITINNLKKLYKLFY